MNNFPVAELPDFRYDGGVTGWNVLRYADVDEARDAIRFYADCVKSGHLPCVLGAELKETGELIGDAGISEVEGKPDETEIGYCIGQKYRGRGYAAELTDAVSGFVFSRFGIRTIYGRVVHGNEASAKVLEKSGYRFVEEQSGAEDDPYGQGMLVYRKDRERLYFEVPGPGRKEDAIAYIREFHEYHSDINGSGGLDRFTDNYEGWLEKLAQDISRVPNEEKVPARTFFLVRDTDRRIVGMINIRLCLNERLSHFGGHIGFSIRPTERGKGYNKINLYLGLKVCAAHGIGKVLMDADLDNPASWKTMEALGGTRTREYYDDVYAHCTVVDYVIDVKKALEEHAGYEDRICPDRRPGIPAM